MLEQYYQVTEATGISITIGKDGEGVFNVCSVAISNNRLSFEKKKTGIDTTDELIRQFPANSYVALNLAGKGILQKQLDGIAEINQHNFGQILPNGNIADFYLQHFVSGNQSFVSVIRKTDADKWISRLRQLGYLPLMLSLGPFPVRHILPQLNVYEGDLIFDGHVIRRNEQSDWSSYTYDPSAVTTFPLKIESETISEKLVTAYAAAFQLLLSDKIEAIRAEVPALAAEYAKLTEGKKLKVYGFLVLAGIFLLLLINFFLFSSLNAANAKLTEQVSRSAQSTSDVQHVNEQVQQKESLLKALGWEGNSNKSIMIDQVAALLPGGVTWREAAIDPIDLNGSRNQKSIVFFDHRIRIAGNSERIIPVNEWLARIKAKNWVKNAQLDSYTFNSEQNTGQFTILIDY